MRKAFGIVIGCTLLCGLVMAAMLAVPPAENKLVMINGNLETGGVYPPLFVLSKSGKDTVQWKNELSVPCTVSFGRQTPFLDEPIDIPALATSKEHEPVKAPDPPKGWKETKPNEIYKVYKYTVSCDGTTFDPGGGMKP